MKKILLVEDNDRDAELVVMELASFDKDVKVDRVSDGVEAMAYLRRQEVFSERDAVEPVLVLLDIKLPRMNGFEVLEQMKADPLLKTIPVVMFTSSSEKNDLKRSYETGVNAYVVKPVDFHDLSDALRHTQRFWCDVNETTFKE